MSVLLEVVQLPFGEVACPCCSRCTCQKSNHLEESTVDVRCYSPGKQHLPSIRRPIQQDTLIPTRTNSSGFVRGNSINYTSRCSRDHSVHQSRKSRFSLTPLYKLDTVESTSRGIGRIIVRVVNPEQHESPTFAFCAMVRRMYHATEALVVHLTRISLDSFHIVARWNHWNRLQRDTIRNT